MASCKRNYTESIIVSGLMFLRFIMCIPVVHFFLFLSIPLHCINTLQFVYPFSYKWKRGSSQLLANMTKAATNTSRQLLEDVWYHFS